MASQGKYLIVDGKIVTEEDYYKVLAKERVRMFAYDPQLQLFPEAKVELAREQLRKRIDSGEELGVVVIWQ